ncbi:MAG TPA: hypothetical protein P5526_16390 [Anaerolineae bacterium]|nr:hypothetical protein [Anaerolineae bacterium]
MHFSPIHGIEPAPPRRRPPPRRLIKPGLKFANPLISTHTQHHNPEHQSFALMGQSEFCRSRLAGASIAVMVSSSGSPRPTPEPDDRQNRTQNV